MSDFELCRRAVEFRAKTKDAEGKPSDGRTLEGYAAVFDDDTEINSWEGKFVERISKGAFRKTLRDKKPIMQYDHGRDSRVGTVPIGVYEELREDDHGLYVLGPVFDNPVVEPVRQAIAAGAITGMSFKFRVVRDTWADNKGKVVRGDEMMKLLYEPGDRGPLVRTIKEVQLFEAGPVASPAYDSTSVGMRSMAEMTDADRADLIDTYRKTMIETEERETDVDEEELRSWLEAEEEWRTNVSAWLDAETTYRTAVAEWLDAERAHSERVSEASTITNEPSQDDAARTGTSSGERETPEDDAARKHLETGSERTTPTPKVKVMNLEELRARLAEIDVRLGELGEECRDKELPEALQTEEDGLVAERAKKVTSIEKIEARIERLADLAGTSSERSGTDRGTPAFRKSEDIYNLDEIRKSSFSGDDFVERATEAAKKGIDKAKMPSMEQSKVDGDKARSGLMEMLERDTEDGWLAKHMVRTGSPVYERAFGRAAMAGNDRGLSEEEHRAIAIATDASGNYAVPFQLDPTLVHLGAGYISPIRQLAKKVQLIGKEYQTLTISEIAVYRAAEAAAAVDSSPTLAQASVKVNKVHGFVPFSIESEQDWPQLRSEVFSLLQEAKDKEEATSFLTGTGTDPQPQGLLTGVTAPSLVAAGTGLTITKADIYKLMEALPVEFEQNAVFLGNKNTFNKVRQLDTNGGGQLWGNDFAKDNPNEILSTPIYRVSAMPTSATNGNKFLVYGDIAKAFTIIDRVGMAIELIPMLFDTTTNRPTGQRGFYAHWRNNSKVVNKDAVRVLTATT